MKRKLIFFIFTACLLTGCRDNKQIDNEDKNNILKTADVKVTKDSTPNPTDIPLMTPELKDNEDEEEEWDISECLSARDLSDIIYPVKDNVYNEVKTGKKKSKKRREDNYFYKIISYVAKSETYASESNDYKINTLEELEKNIKQKKFKGKCIKVEGHPIDFYNIAQIYDGDVNDIDVEFGSEYEATIDYENKIRRYNIYYKNKVNNKVDAFNVKIPFDYDLNVDSGENPMVAHAINNNYVAVSSLYSGVFGVCVIDLKDRVYHLINFSDVIDEEFYSEENYICYEEILEMTFVGNEKLALKFRSGQIVVYDIKNGIVINNIKTARIPYEDSVDDMMNLKYDISLDEGICNLTYKNDDGTYDYYAIDLNTMQIVSHVENPDRYFIDFMGLYKDGVTYFTNSYGLYAYNPETKGYDCIYDQMENDTEYTWEKIKDDKYRDVFVKPLFKGNDIYLCRGIRHADDCVDWEEAICKKLTIK